MPINKTPINVKTKEFELTNPKYSFDDVVLTVEAENEIKLALGLYVNAEEIYGEWGLDSVVKRRKGMSINLYGPSGTGKTITAHAIANILNKQMLFVNYGEIESKFVGETAKNLQKMFDYANENDVVIIFDEADALLSKRVSSMTNATDVSVNQTRNVLLRLLDEYSNPIVFTTNFIKNYDKAFFRRITTHISIGYPDYDIRKKLWDRYLVSEERLESSRSDLLNFLAEIEKVTGADIENCVIKAVTRAVLVGKKVIGLEDIQRELESIQKVNQIDRLGSMGSDYSVSTHTVSKDYVEEKQYWLLTTKLKGSNIVNMSRCGDEWFVKMGKILGKLHQAFGQCENDIEYWNNSLLGEMESWVYDNLKKEELDYLEQRDADEAIEELRTIDEELPRNLIHRDVHLGNFLFCNGEFSGYVDFDLSQKNIRIFDLCYFLLGLLLEEEENQLERSCSLLWFGYALPFDK